MPHNTCATVDVYVLALACVMNSVVVPWLVVALLARRLEAAASVSTSTQPLSKLQARPPSMSALARRRFSLSDSALLGNAEGPLSTSNGGTVRGVRTRCVCVPFIINQTPAAGGDHCHGPQRAALRLGSVGNPFDRVWPPTTSGHLQPIFSEQ